MSLGVTSYPTAIDTDTELFSAVDRLKSTLSAEISSSAVTLTLVSGTNFPSTGGIILIGQELISYTSKSTNTLSGLTRAYASTTAVTHPSNAEVKLIVAAAHHNVLVDAIQAIEGELGISPKGSFGTVVLRLADLDTSITTINTSLGTKVAKAGDTMTGALVLPGDPTLALQAAPKQYVDTGDTLKVNKAGDTMTGLLLLSGDPAAALGAATKQYVDSGDSASLASISAKVSKSGDTMTGALVLSGDPTLALHPTTKQYVDAINTTLTASLAAKVNKAGDTMTGALVLSGAPTLALHASTKQYVDDLNTTLSATIASNLAASVIILPTTSARNTIQPSGAAIIPLTVKGFASQSADLQEWQDSTAIILARINSSGWLGVGTLPTTKFHVSGDMSSTAWGTAGILFRLGTPTITDTSGSGTVTDAVISDIGIPVINANSAVTYTRATTLQIEGPPTAGTNVTITNPWSLRIATGNSRFFGKVLVGSAAANSATAILGVQSSISTSAWGILGVICRFGDATAVVDTSSSGTVATAVLNSFTTSTLGASSATTFTDVATLYISGAPTAGSGATLTNTYGLWSKGNTRLDGSVAAGNSNIPPSGVFSISGSYTAAAWGANGAGLKVALTLVDSSTADGATVSNNIASVFFRPTFTTSNASTGITYTHSATVYISGEGIPGSNVTLSNPYSLWIARGNVRIDANLKVGSTQQQSLSILDVEGTYSTTAWGLSGAGVRVVVGTLTDSSTADAATVTNIVAHSISRPTFAATNASTGITYTHAASLYLANSPTTSGLVTLTNKYTIWVDAGAVRFDDALSVGTGAIAVGQLDVQPTSASTIGLIVKGAASQSGNLQEWQNSSATILFSITSAGHNTFGEGVNQIFGTTTGTKLGTATSQKLSLWNATPIVQPTTSVAAATFVTNTSGTVNDSATFDGYTIGQVVKALRNIGILA